MSEEQEYQWTPEYDEPHSDEESVQWEAPEQPEIDEEELKARIAARKKRRRFTRIRKKSFRLIALLVVFALLLTMCGKEIVRLKRENYALRKQHEELEAQRDRLAKELENVHDKDYIKDQARKQLNLLDPGEILFIFDDGSEDAESEDAAGEGGSGD